MLNGVNWIATLANVNLFNWLSGYLGNKIGLFSLGQLVNFQNILLLIRLQGFSILIVQKVVFF